MKLRSSVNEISPKRKKAFAISNTWFQALGMTCEKEGVFIGDMIEPTAQKLAAMCAASAMMQKPIDIDDLLTKFREEVQLCTREMLGAVGGGNA